MHGQNRAMIGPALLDPNHCVGGEPVVGVDYVKMSVTIFLLKKVPCERAAHVLHFVDEIVTGFVRAVVVPDAIDLVYAAIAVAGPGENVNRVSFSTKCCREFCYM